MSWGKVLGIYSNKKKLKIKSSSKDPLSDNFKDSFISGCISFFLFVVLFPF